jgi:predicted dehydrogenase
MVSGFHLPGWRALGDKVELVAIADPDLVKGQARADQFGIGQVYNCMDSMINACQLDAVDIMTPPATHAANCELAAASGIAILCQKPLAPSWSQAAELNQRLAKRVRLMVHENWRFRPHYRLIHQWLKQGRIGNFLHGEIDVRSCGLLADSSHRLPALVRQPLLATLPRLMIAEVLVHHLDIAVWLAGAHVVTSTRIRHDVPQVAGESAARIELANAKQQAIVVAGNMADPQSQPALRDSVRLVGDSGQIELVGTTLKVLSDEPTTHEFDFDSDYSQSYAAAIAHFVCALQADLDFETPPEWHLCVLKLAEEAYRLCENRRETQHE